MVKPATRPRKAPAETGASGDEVPTREGMGSAELAPNRNPAKTSSMAVPAVTKYVPAEGRPAVPSRSV